MPSWMDETAQLAARASPHVPAGFGETYGAYFSLSWEELMLHRETDQEKALADLVTRAEEVSGQPIDMGASSIDFGVNPAANLIEAEENKETALDQYRSLHEQNPEAFAKSGLPEPNQALLWIRERSDQRTEERVEPVATRAAHISGKRQGSEWAAFLGGASADMLDPVFAPLFLFGGGFAYKAGAGVVKNALRVGAAEGLLNLGVETVKTPHVLTLDEMLDRESDTATRLALAFFGGAVLGGSVPIAGALAKGGAKAAGSQAGKATRALGVKLGRLEYFENLARVYDEAVSAGMKPTRMQRAARVLVTREALTEAANPYSEFGQFGWKAFRHRLQTTQEALETGRAYDVLIEQPQGKWDDLAVTFKPEDIEQVVLSRGGWKGRGDATIKGAGFGHVKIVWRHGEKSSKLPEFQITRDDVLKLPEILRTKSLAIRDETGNIVEREWRVWLPWKNGKREVVVSARSFVEEGNDLKRIMTMYVQEPGKPRYQKKNTPGSSNGGSFPVRDTAPGDVVRYPSEGQASPKATPNMALPEGQVKGNHALVITPTGRRFDAQYEVVELDDLLSSHDPYGKVNPNFPKDLQPRNRSSHAYQGQIEEMAGGLEPTLLGRSASADQGAPIIGPDNVVESGNGRVAALTKVYEAHPNKAASYQAFLKQEGFDLKGMKRPVLVRKRTTDLPPEDRVALAREANQSSTADLAMLERGMTDARALGPGWLDDFQGGDVASGYNRPFVSRFLETLTKEERVAILTKDGGLSLYGKQRLEAAMMVQAYGDSPILQRLLESTDNNIKGLGGAMLDAAPAMARLEGLIARGSVPPEFSLRKNLTEVAAKLAHARDRGHAASEIIDQLDFFEKLSPTTEALLRSLFTRSAKGRWQQISRPRMARIFDSYSEQARKQSTQTGLDLGMDVIQPTHLLEAAIGRADISLRPPELDLEGADHARALVKEKPEAQLPSKVAQELEQELKEAPEDLAKMEVGDPDGKPGSAMGDEIEDVVDDANLGTDAKGCGI